MDSLTAAASEDTERLSVARFPLSPQIPARDSPAADNTGSLEDLDFDLYHTILNNFDDLDDINLLSIEQSLDNNPRLSQTGNQSDYPARIPSPTPWTRLSSDRETGLASITAFDLYGPIARAKANSEIVLFPGSPIASPITLCNEEKESMALRHYNTHMISSLSVKDAKWNIFACLLHTSQRFSQSPTKRSLIAWAATHVNMKGKEGIDMGLQYYSSASEDVLRLSRDLEARILSPDPCKEGSSQISTQISMLLSASFFLCQRDVMHCNMVHFRERISSLKRLVSSSWGPLSNHLSGIDYRLLLWLSYLDIRASILFGGSCHQHDIAESSDTTLLGTIAQQENLHSVYLMSRSYLKEGFGDTYPSSELRGDMLQDPVNLQFLESMALLSRIISLGKNAHDTPSPHSPAVGDLRSRLDRLRQECDLALGGFLDGDQVIVSRTSYHWLNLRTVYGCGVILLNRTLHPEVRTDAEAQHEARQILRTILKLKTAKMLHNPHSMFSTLPLFVAGIEVDDDLYKDWTLRIFEDFNDWGLHVQRACRLLRGVMKEQDRSGRRLRMNEMLDSPDSSIFL
ncbi:hypothetical protein NM208_g7898 [Fusarium decemcellulare]|uniref:Uncharacterized protein n=1 Tax=Fusarium decemcellulare TaxID=57161 RepID=A0ACC1S7A6_9HYPO|nr:hypothetical protein NM208_g7898 [Fusarium decemcellulare]